MHYARVAVAFLVLLSLLPTVVTKMKGTHWTLYTRKLCNPTINQIKKIPLKPKQELLVSDVESGPMSY